MRGFASFAPAKINLFLRVGPLAPNGRHPLFSAAAFADVGDELRVFEADDLTLEIDGPFAAHLAPASDNLVLRAARTLAERAGVAPRGHLHLTKRLPIASGIGGGSSDAAAALRALNALWRLGVDDAALLDTATSLGADVPVCVRSQPALMSGEGETLTRLETPQLYAVLANPGVAVATAEVYRAFDRLSAASPPPTGFVWGADPIESLATLGNDLQTAAIALAPAIAEALDALRGLSGAKLVRMSGSGATCFALTATYEDAAAMADELGRARPLWWIAAARLGAVDVGVQAL